MRLGMQEYGQSALKQYRRRLLNIERKRNSGTPVKQKTSGKTWKMFLKIEILMTINCLNFFLFSLT
jgi:hypothetical protein